ncbi:VOC family protein [Guptibacillus hwajinpoensis]|uniref:PhnB protein n=1 Tax=Guptibacillus hwajinpoensis TaxID=208199 RepID=A0ABU0K6P9_9BACL|nr:VOC family protein [Alkalihalobacillus hemicentroti]MDQ0483969.1 PhnB protein [Alkalihalobacillus hemicentroti]
MTLSLTPFLNLKRNAKEAIEFYEKALGAEVLSMMTYGDMSGGSDTYPEDLKDLVATAKLQIGESALMISDVPDATNVEASKQITIGITTNDVEKSKRIFEALQQEGTVNMPFGEQPFSPGFGDVTDKFGVSFLVYTEI